MSLSNQRGSQYEADGSCTIRILQKKKNKQAKQKPRVPSLTVGIGVITEVPPHFTVASPRMNRAEPDDEDGPLASARRLVHRVARELTLLTPYT